MKENVQPFIWALEFVTFIVAIVVVWYVWSISKRASKRRKLQQEDVQVETVKLKANAK